MVPPSYQDYADMRKAGIVPNRRTQEKPCPTCDGSGKVAGFLGIARTCPACEGRGWQPLPMAPAAEWAPAENASFFPGVASSSVSFSSIQGAVTVTDPSVPAVSTFQSIESAVAFIKANSAAPTKVVGIPDDRDYKTGGPAQQSLTCPSECPYLQISDVNVDRGNRAVTDYRCSWAGTGIYLSRGAGMPQRLPECRQVCSRAAVRFPDVSEPVPVREKPRSTEEPSVFGRKRKMTV
jgi:hypothetical protein